MEKYQVGKDEHEECAFKSKVKKMFIKVKWSGENELI